MNGTMRGAVLHRVFARCWRIATVTKIQSMNGVPGKETIYIDVDDEITTIIDKVQTAKGKVVALVLPKRSPVLQSIVNMKLLKRTAESADKNLVLVTAEHGLMPLAGAVGIHVASTPNSKPSIPNAPKLPGDGPETIDEPLHIVDGSGDADAVDFDRSAAADKSIGELDAVSAAGSDADDDLDGPISLDDEETDDTAATPAEPAEAAPRGKKPKKNKKLKVPNFDSFRKRLFLAFLAIILLAAGWVYAVKLAPKATIKIRTDSSTITSNIDLTLSTAAKTLDTANDVVPATAQSVQKTSSQQVPATGQQNNGNKAAGTAQFSETKCSGSGNPQAIAVGTSISTSGGNVYVVQDTASFTVSGVNYPCVTFTTNNVNITALNGGSNYNTSGSVNFSVTGRSGVTGTGSATGGTDAIIKIVTQNDINNATSKITAADTSTVKSQLESDLQSKGLVPVSTTFLAGTPTVTPSATAGTQADTVTVKATTTYTMLGVSKTDLQKLVDADVTSQLDKGKQVILNDGVSNAQFTEPLSATATTANVSMTTKSLAGPQINIAKLKAQLVGKKSGDVLSFIKQTPGVTGVTVHFSPFWVDSVPKNLSKTTIQIIKAKT